MGSFYDIQQNVQQILCWVAAVIGVLCGFSFGGVGGGILCAPVGALVVFLIGLRFNCN